MWQHLIAAASAWETASTTASNADWEIVGRDGLARHTHGGPAARLGHAEFRVTYRGRDAGELSVSRVEFLTGHDCVAPPATVQSEPAFGGLFTSGMSESASKLEVKPARPVDVSVSFPAVEAYYVHCDRFAFRVVFVAGGEALVVVAETNVTREEPLRQP